MHSWQDIVLAVGSLIFAAALLPSILCEHKPALWTSIMTGSVLIVFAVTYATLSLWYAMVTTSLTAVMWAVLAVQKVLQRRD
jgi:hypothetical protein